MVMTSPLQLMLKEPPGRCGKVADVQGWRTGNKGNRPARRLPYTPAIEAGTRTYRGHKKSAIGAVAPLLDQVAKPGRRIGGDEYTMRLRLAAVKAC